MVAFQVPGNAELAQVVGAPQVKDLLFDVSGRAQLGILRARLGIDQAGLAFVLIGPFPFIESLSGDAEVTAGVGYVFNLFSVIEYPEFPPDVVQMCRAHLPPPRLTLAFSIPLSTEVVVFIDQQPPFS